IFDVGVESERDGAVDRIRPAADNRGNDVIAVIDGEGIVTCSPDKGVLASGTSDRRHQFSLPMSKGVGKSRNAESCRVAAQSHATAGRRREISRHIRLRMIKER